MSFQKEIEEAVSKLRVKELRDWNADVNAKRKEAEAHAEMLEALRKGNYPERAILALGAMTGPGLEKAMEIAPMVVRPKADAILLLLGDRGAGKTQMATWLASQRHRNGHGCGKYVKAFDLLAEIKASWTAKNTEEADILRKYKMAGFLVVDEFQERSESEWDNRTLTNILDHRYDRMLATVLIANLTTEEAGKHIPRSILSRCQETGGQVMCDWGSYRETQQ